MNKFKIGDLVAQNPVSNRYIKESKVHKVKHLCGNYFMVLEDVSSPVWIHDFILVEKPDES